MSIQSPVGTLDIKNATLRVGKLEVSNIQGVDTALNVTRANSVLIYDDQVSTTTFNGFTSSVGVRDTGNGYLDLAGGYVYWGQKLPNSWVMDFEMDIRSGTNAGPLYANVFSTTNTGGDGYSFTFNDSNNKISLYYDSTLLTETNVSGLFTASEDWQKVVINYERGLIAISLDGSRKFYYKDIERETPYVNGEYVSFSSASTDGRKIRDLRIVNGEKWVYSGESNVVYTQGSVGIGVTDPTVALDVSGTVKATAFDGDGSAITNISSANVGDFASNVVRIENLETSNGHIWSNLASNVTTLRGEIDSNLATSRTDLQSNVTILRDEIDSNLATARTDLQSNVTILRDEIDSNLATARTDLQSNVTILRDEIDSNLATARTDLQSNVTILRGEIDSNLATARTDLQSNVTILRGEIDSNLATARTDLQSNVTILRDEIDSNLATARTDLQSNVTILRDTAITFMGTKTFQDDVVLESNLRVQGDLLVANTVNMTVSDPILELGSNNLNTGDVGIVMTRHGASNSNVAVFFDETADTLKLGYTLNGAEDSTLEFDSNALAVSVQGALTATSVSGNGSGLTSLNATNISSGTINKDRLPTTLNNTTIESAGHGTLTISDSAGEYKIANGGDLATNTRVTIDTAGQVGIATDSPAYTLDVHGTSNVGALTATSVSGNGSGLTSLNADNLSSGTVPSARLSLTASDIPSLDADKITTGTIDSARLSLTASDIPSLDAAKITTGTIDSGRLSLTASDIPSLDASKITSGTLGRPISTTTGVFTSDGNVVLVGPSGGGQVGLTINDGDGNTNITFNHASRIPDQNGSSGRIDCGVDGTSGYMRLRVKDNVTGGTSTGNLPECVRIEEGYVRAYSNFYVDDNVGIGTTNPGARLEVLGNSANQWGNILYLKNSAGSNRLSLKDEQTSPYIPPGLWTGAGGGLSIGSQYEGIMFYASASGATPVERMRITSGGNVGIGTNAPMKSLDVRNGDGEAAANWISGVFGSKTGLSSNPRVVVGTYSNVAIVGSHNGDLTAWNDLYLNDPSYPCVVKANGSVGIGTASPIYKLDVRGDVYVDNSSVFMSGYTEGPKNNTVYSQYVGKRYSGRILAGMEIENVRTNSAGTAITTTGHYGQKLHFRAHDYGIYGGSVGDRTMSIVGNSVGIGTTSPSYKLHVSGDIYATGNVIAYSDVRKKKNLEIIEKPVEKVNKLNGYTYEMDDKRYTGLVAQEVLKVLPEAVVGDEENGYGLAYGNMVGLLVEALKEVNEQLQAEKAKVATVLARLDALENA